MDSVYREFTALMKKHAFAEAVAIAERQSIAAGDKSEFWLSHLSGALREAGRVDEALEAAQKACALAPRSAWAHLASGEALMKKNRFDEAFGFFEEALADARAVPRGRRGVLLCLSHLEKWERVLTLLQEWEIPEDEAISWRVKALMGLGRSDEAEAACDTWLSRSPDNPQALWKKTELQIAREGLEPVRDRMARIARIPGKPAVYAEIYATLCKRSGAVDDALEQYEKLSQGGGDPAILRKQAFALAKSGHEARAVPLMEELMRLSPADVYLHKAYLPACTRLGDIDRAWKFYHELLALHPSEKTLYGRLKHVQKMLEAKETGGGRERNRPT